MTRSHELDADHQALAAHVADERVLLLQRRECRHQVCADRRGVGDQLLLQQLDRRCRRGAGDGIAAERAGVRAGRPRHHLGARAGDTERQPRRDPFGDGDDVGLQAEVLRGEHPAGPAHAGLHFVDDEQDAVLRRQLAQPLQERRRRDEVAALALDGLDDDGRDFVGRDEVREELILDEREALRRAGVALPPKR